MLPALALVAATALSVPATADERAGLVRMRQVSVRVDIAHPVEAVTAEDLAAHVVTALRGATPPLGIEDSAPDRLRVTVAVRPMGATALRGFWLPFSGTYAIGAVRLGVERMVTLPGSPRAIPAVVWETERTVGGPWHGADRQIARLLDEMVAEFLDARRR